MRDDIFNYSKEHEKLPNDDDDDDELQAYLTDMGVKALRLVSRFHVKEYYY